MSEDRSYQSLKEAIEAGDLDKVKDLVENGQLDLNNPDWEGDEKPLILAVKSRSPGLVEYLIEKGADPSFKESNDTLLHQACYSSGHWEEVFENRLEIIKVLVETGAFHEVIETPYYRGYTPVFNTCGFGDAIECFKYFTEKFPNLLRNEEYRNLYLIHAAAKKQFALMEALLDAGADINAIDKHGKSPLLAFALSCRAPIGYPFPKESASIDCMRYLIEKGADPLYKRRVHEGLRIVSGGDNLLHAILEGMPTEPERRIEYGYDITGMGLGFFKELLEKGISCDEKNMRGSRGKMGRTPKEMLIEMTMVEWLDCLKKFEGGDGSEPPQKVNFGEPSECRIYYGGIQVLREYINIVLKDGEEIDGSRTAWEKGSFHFTWMLPRSLNILFDALAKGADWVHYFEDSYRKKWQSEKPDIDYDECEFLGGNGMSPGDYFFDSNDDYIDRESIAEFEDGWTGDTESIYFEASHRGNLTLRDEEGNWIRFDPMPNDYWKISQGTSEDSEKQPLHVDLVSGDEFDLIERVKEICGTPALERKIFLHRNGITYGPYNQSSVERFLLENLASPNDWAIFKGEKDWVRLEELLM